MTEPHGHHYIGVLFTIEVTTEGSSATEEQIVDAAAEYVSHHILRPNVAEEIGEDFSLHFKPLASDYNCDDTEAPPTTVDLEEALGPIARAMNPQEFMDAINEVIAPKQEEQTDAVVYDLFKEKKKKMGG